MSSATVPEHLSSFDFGKSYIWTEGSISWGQIDPGINTGNILHPESWGPESQFAYNWRIAHPNPADVLLIVKLARGSTSLAGEPDVDWSPNSTGELFDNLADMIDNARHTHAPTKPDWPFASAIFWMQGEDDAKVFAEANAYEDNLRELIPAAREEWAGGYDVPFILGRITDSAAMPYSEAVRVAQWNVALGPNAVPGVQSFKTIGFGLQPDGIHYNAGGHVALGQAFWDNWAV